CPKRSGLNGSVQAGPLRMVECVQKHSLQLEMDAFCNWHQLVQRHVRVEGAWVVQPEQPSNRSGSRILADVCGIRSSIRRNILRIEHADIVLTGDATRRQLLLELRWRDAGQRDVAVVPIEGACPTREQVWLSTLPGDDRTNRPSSDHRVGDLVVIEEALPTSEGEVVGSAGVHHVTHIEGAGEIVQPLVAQRIETGSTVTAAAVIPRRRAALNAGPQRFRKRVVHIELHAMVDVLAEVDL